MNTRPFFKQASEGDFEAIRIYTEDMCRIGAVMVKHPCPLLNEQLRRTSLLLEFIQARIQNIVQRESAE